MKVATSILVAIFALLALVACDACSGGKLTIQPAPSVQWDGGADKADRACAILSAAGCASGQSPICAEALRNASQQPGGSDVALDCILDAGPNATSLHACSACQ